MLPIILTQMPQPTQQFIIDFANGPTLPTTAEEALALIMPLALAWLAGLIGNALTDFIKDLPWPDIDGKKLISGPIADLVAALTSIIGGVALSYLGPWAEYLDEQGIWLIIAAAWPIAKTWFEAKKGRKWWPL